jgi:ATP-dependent 26S proteasome regulatory subunit
MCKSNIFLNYVVSGFPLLWVDTFEEYRAMTRFAKELSTRTKNPYQMFSWDRSDGIRMAAFENGILKTGKIDNADDVPLNEPIIALDWIENKMPECSVIFLKDFHHYAKKDIITRKLRNLVPYFKAVRKVIVIVAPVLDIPIEIEKECTLIKYALPDLEDLRITLRGLCENIEKPYPENDQELLNAALGMTAFEAENAFSVSIVECKGVFDAAVVRREKAAIVKKTDMIEVIDCSQNLNDVGGLDNMKAQLDAYQSCFSREAADFGIDPVKGMLLAGLPGTGKSLSAKAVAQTWKRPLFRLDFGRVMKGIVGESEEAIRRVLAIISANAPCVLWIDEIEKAFAGIKAGTAHEVSQKIFGTFLTWFNDHTEDVFVIATANDVENLPPALIRRFEMLFWVDLPDDKQRQEILSIHLRKKSRDPAQFALKDLSKLSDGFSGAEIEVWLRKALVRAFNAKQDLTTEHLRETVTMVKPVSKMMAADIQKSREWAESHGMDMASSSKLIKVMDAPARRRIDTN